MIWRFIFSAGIGRTGTFIGLDYLLAEAKRGNGVSPYDCVELMRQRRPKMIQTEVSAKTFYVQTSYLVRLICRVSMSAIFHVFKRYNFSAFQL